MSSDTECIGENDTVSDAAERLADLDVGAVPICGEDDRLKGMISDRDIAIEVIAQGKDPSQVKASELGGEEVVTIGADDPIDEALRTMKDHKVRRLPVIDDQKLIGMVSIADLAGNIEDDQVGDLVEAISAAP
jgi:CBS domain-containing protein